MPRGVCVSTTGKDGGLLRTHTHRNFYEATMQAASHVVESMDAGCEWSRSLAARHVRLLVHPWAPSQHSDVRRVLVQRHSATTPPQKPLRGDRPRRFCGNFSRRVRRGNGARVVLFRGTRRQTHQYFVFAIRKLRKCMFIVGCPWAF